MKFVVAACLAFLLAITHGAACSCATRKFAEELKDTDTRAVFVGRCVSRTDHDKYFYEYVFEVERTWKNPLPSRVSVLSSKNGSSCGYLFSPDARYVVWTSMHFISTDRQMLATGLCTRTTTANSEEGTTQVAALEKWQEHNVAITRAWRVGSVLALCIMAASVVAWQRRSSHALAK